MQNVCFNKIHVYSGNNCAEYKSLNRKNNRLKIPTPCSGREPLFNSARGTLPPREGAIVYRREGGPRGGL